MSPEEFEKHQARIKASARVVKLEPEEPKRGRPRKLKMPKPPVVPRPITTTEGRFAAQLIEAGIKAERQFHWCPGRKFRADFALPDRKLLIEVDGAVHRIRGQFHRDIRKRQEAIIHGWTMLPIDTEQVRDGTAVEVVRRVLGIT